MKVKEFADFLLSLPDDQQQMVLRIQGCDQCWLEPTRDVSVELPEEPGEPSVLLVLT